MEVIRQEDLKEMLLQICDSVCANEKMLCELDAYVGDGDHGTTMARGFRAAENTLRTKSFADFSTMLYAVAEELENAMGGAIGPIFASLFEAAAEVCEGKQTLGTEEWAQILLQGCDAVKELGGAKPGDRTLVDALSPASEELLQAYREKQSLPEALQRAALAAENGAEKTAGMVAKKGRAKFLGEKSLGHRDAGAVSLSLVLRSAADYVSRQ